MYRKNGNQPTFSGTYSSLEQKILGTVTISLAGMLHFKKFKYENVHKMQSKPDPALLPTLYLSIEIKKRITKSHKTIPLKTLPVIQCFLLLLSVPRSSYISPFYYWFFEIKAMIVGI
jgi:hypothetical protein